MVERERERERGGGGKERRTGRRRPSIPPFPPLLSLKGTIFSPRDEEKKNSPFLVFLPGRARIRHAENRKIFPPPLNGNLLDA